MAKSENKHRLTAELSTEKGGIIFTVIDRETDKPIENGEAFFAASEIHANVRQAVGLYGYSKLLQDRTSEVPAGPDKVKAMREVAALLAAGEWRREREVGAPVVSAEVEALAQLYGKTVPEIQAALKGYSAEQRKEILAKEKVVSLAKTIREAREKAPEATLDLAKLD